MQEYRTANMRYRQEDEMVFLVTVPFSIHVNVEAENEEDITEDAVFEAILQQHGKYPEVDARDMGRFEVIDAREDD